jgi:hypothetical protein
VLEANDRVLRVCSTEILLASRQGAVLEVAEDRWLSTVLPPTPDDRAAGRSVYRCLGRIQRSEGSTGSAFRPR